MGSPVKAREWEKTLTVKCRLCGGAKCKRCSESAALAKTNSPVLGLHADWVTDRILGMMRPSSRLMNDYQIAQQFHKYVVTVAVVGAVSRQALAMAFSSCCGLYSALELREDSDSRRTDTGVLSLSLVIRLCSCACTDCTSRPCSTSRYQASTRTAATDSWPVAFLTTPRET